jgi:hypothetical protein
MVKAEIRRMMKKTRNKKTPSKTVWDKIRQISGKRKTHQIRHLITSNGVKTRLI